jgi:hypothetical protein
MGLTSSNFAKELGFNIDDVIYCEFLTMHLIRDKKFEMIDPSVARGLLHKLDKCHYIQVAYMYNQKQRLILTLSNGKLVEIGLSNCGNYIGKPCNASRITKWYYILDENGNKTQPFNYLFQ